MLYPKRSNHPMIKHNPPSGVTKPIAEADMPVKSCVEIMKRDPEKSTIPAMKKAPLLFNRRVGDSERLSKAMPMRASVCINKYNTAVWSVVISPGSILDFKK